MGPLKEPEVFFCKFFLPLVSVWIVFFKLGLKFELFELWLVESEVEVLRIGISFKCLELAILVGFTGLFK